MPNMQERLNAAVDQAEIDTALLHNVVHGSIVTEVNTEGGKVPSVAKVLNDIQVKMEANEKVLYLIANGDSTTVVHTDNGDVPSVAKAIQDVRNEILSQTNDLIELAQTSAEKATEQALNSSRSASYASEAVETCQDIIKEARIWTEGTDAEITILGGQHSCREWVKLAESSVRGSFPTTVNGVAIANQVNLPLPEAIYSLEQILSVNVENISLMPDNYTLSNDKKTVVLLYPISEGERWSVKYLTDFESISAVLDSVLYEDM